MTLSSRTIVVVLVAGIVGCQQNPAEERMSAPPPPPAALIAPVASHMTLDERLARLEIELDAAIAGGMRQDVVPRMFRAEAITDRILEGEPPFLWLADQYFVDSRLRGLQAHADRIVALIRRAESPDVILPEVVELRHSVATLREQLAAGAGGDPPVPLDSLLAGAAPDTLGPLPTDEPIH
ncbi:MAG TPA: hypothetical protein VNZ57_08730 [Longimicrobiales bacterium]|nr:hypothetical protein [Longimicrobiales bacterium]